MFQQRRGFCLLIYFLVYLFISKITQINIQQEQASSADCSAMTFYDVLFANCNEYLLPTLR